MKTKAQSRTKKKPAKSGGIRLSWALFSCLVKRGHPARVDLTDKNCLSTFRTYILYEHNAIVDAWEKSTPPIPARDVAAYLRQRLARLSNAELRSFYKINMAKAFGFAYGSGKALGLVRQALRHLLRTMKDADLLGYCLLEVVKFAIHLSRYKEVPWICHGSCLQLEKIEGQPHGLPEIQRLWAYSMYIEGWNGPAYNVINMAEKSASVRAYYMPALWNRIYETKAKIMEARGDQKAVEECMAAIERNNSTYMDFETADFFADGRLYGMDRKPPRLKPADEESQPAQP